MNPKIKIFSKYCLHLKQTRGQHLSPELTEMFKQKLYPEVKMQLTSELLQIVCPLEVANHPETQKQKRKKSQV